MSEILTAIYQDGAFVPEEATNIPPGARVKLTVEQAEEAPIAPFAASHRTTYATKLAALSEEKRIHSGLKLTRDELHERD